MAPTTHSSQGKGLNWVARPGPSESYLIEADGDSKAKTISWTSADRRRGRNCLALGWEGTSGVGDVCVGLLSQTNSAAGVRRRIRARTEISVGSGHARCCLWMRTGAQQTWLRREVVDRDSAKSSNMCGVLGNWCRLGYMIRRRGTARCPADGTSDQRHYRCIGMG